MHRLDAVHRPVGLPGVGDAAAAGSDHDEAGGEQREDRGRVEDLERLGRGDDAPPAALAAVLPRLAVLDERLAPRGARSGRRAWSASRSRGRPGRRACG